MRTKRMNTISFMRWLHVCMRERKSPFIRTFFFFLFTKQSDRMNFTFTIKYIYLIMNSGHFPHLFAKRNSAFEWSNGVSFIASSYIPNTKLYEATMIRWYIFYYKFAFFSLFLSFFLISCQSFLQFYFQDVVSIYLSCRTEIYANNKFMCETSTKEREREQTKKKMFFTIGHRHDYSSSGL